MLHQAAGWNCESRSHFLPLMQHIIIIYLFVDTAHIQDIVLLLFVLVYIPEFL